jgi:hypothetical protein
MSISTVIMMKGMAALARPACGGAEVMRGASFHAVVRRFLGDLHVVDVALADAGRGDLDELGGCCMSSMTRSRSSASTHAGRRPSGR